MLNTSLGDVMSERTRKGHSVMGWSILYGNERIVSQSYHTLDYTRDLESITRQWMLG